VLEFNSYRLGGHYELFENCGVSCFNRVNGCNSGLSG
jgi:hypothetical protein